MPSSLSSSPSSEDDKHTSADEDVTPKASPKTSEEVKEEDDNDKTLTMPSTSQCFQPTSSPPLGRSAPSSQEATSPPAARRVETPVEQEYYYFTTDMANQAAIDIEREKEKFDSLITWYKLQQEDVPNLGTCSVGTSAAPSYASDKGSSTPMSSQPSSHQSGASSSNGALSGQNGFNYSPYGAFENDPKSNDPLQCMSDPVDLDDICPTLENFMSAPSTSAAAAAGLPPSGPSTSRPSNQPGSSGLPPRNNDFSTMTGIVPHPTRYMQDPTTVMMMNTPNGPMPYPQQSPLHPLNFNQQATPTSSSNPPSNAASLKRKATEDFSSDGPMKQAKVDDGSPSQSENCPMRRLEMMANPQNFRNGNTINDVVEANKKDDRAAKLEKLEGIEKSVEEEMAQQAREAHMKRMQQAAPPFPSPGQYPGAMPPFPGMPGMPPQHPGMMPPGAPFSAGASHPMNGQFPPHHPMYPGMPATPTGYPMSAPGKIPFGSPSYPSSTPSPAAMAAMQQQQQQREQQQREQQAREQQARAAQAGPQIPPGGHPGMMTPQQQKQYYEMQYMAHMNALRASQNVAHAVGLSPNLASRPPQMGPGGLPPNHPSHPMFQQYQQYQQMMMMRQMQAASGSQQPGAPPAGHPGMGGMPPGMMPPGMMHPGMMPPGMMPPGMMPPGMHPGMMPPGMMPPGMHPGMPGMPQGMHPGMQGGQPGMPGMPQGMPGMPGMPPQGMPGMPGMPPGMAQGMPPGMPPMPGMPGMPGTSSAAPIPQNPTLMVAGNRPTSGEATPNPNGNGQQPMYQLTPHYPPPFFMPPSSGSGPATPR
ncbi:hypothetical protein CAEBREN_25865 [Caenorhabditis brenneri]|uniref:Uncharacterized protein n=1 Tax=Caenorhabditis brenneri TaxID=135651 RepID=G0NYN8_CAEBE|nr:hypothetical protein CAEBREN_25865 [Caenorhabditis brenneri]